MGQTGWVTLRGRLAAQPRLWPHPGLVTGQRCRRIDGLAMKRNLPYALNADFDAVTHPIPMEGQANQFMRLTRKAP